MTILIRKTQVAAKIEGTEGVAETLAAADGLRISNFNFVPTIDMVERNLLGSDLSAFASLPGKRSGIISFDVELKGSGTAGDAPEWGELLKACGFSETIVGGASVTYAPISASIPSMTLAGYLDGMKFLLLGVRGTVVFDITAGQAGKMSFTFTGADFTVTDEAQLSITYDTLKPPVALATSLTIDGFSFKISQLMLDIGNEITLRDDINSSSGNFSALIGRRRAIGSMDPELMLVADYDAYGKWRAGTEGALSIVLDGTAGNIITLTGPKLRPTNLGLGERGVLRTLAEDFEVNRNAGNDELVIALT